MGQGQMKLNQARLDSLLAQLNLALTGSPVSAIQVAMLRAQIADLRAQIQKGEVQFRRE